MKTPSQRIAVIGGGAAGFFGAVTAAARDPAAEVCLLEKSRHYLAKVRISGGGRCNVTHACFAPDSLAENYPRGSRELKRAFQHFQPQDTIEWFESRGVRLKTEADGRIFPVTDQSSTIIDCLLAEARRHGVQLRTGQHVSGIRAEDSSWLLSIGPAVEQFDRVLVATGGWKDGTFWEGTAHRPIPPAPSLFTFRLEESSLLAGLAGIGVTKVRLWLPGTKLESRGPLLITHEGLSGPVVLKLSAHGAREMQEANYRFPLRICWQPDFSEEALRVWLQQQRTSSPAKKVFNTPLPGISGRLWEALLLHAGVHGETRWTTLSRGNIHAMVETLLRCEVLVHGKSTNKDEFVTCGGIARQEIDWNRMESRLHRGLHFAGEVVDVDGITGGFNFQAAWTTGWLAGRAMAEAGS